MEESFNWEKELNGGVMGFFSGEKELQGNLAKWQCLGLGAIFSCNFAIQSLKLRIFFNRWKKICNKFISIVNPKQYHKFHHKRSQIIL